MIWTGALTIIIASVLIGRELAIRLERRSDLLRHLNVALETLDTEVAFAMMPLADVFEQISRQLPSPTNELFYQVSLRLNGNEVSAETAWETVLNEWTKETDLENEDAEILEHFGKTLGKQDLSGQRKQIQLTRSYLTNMEKAARDQQKKYHSMYRSLGLLGGLLLVIILL